MKAAYSIFAILCILTTAAQEPKGKTKPRPINVPTYFYKAEEFTNMSEADRLPYTIGLMDGFLGSEAFGANDGTITKLSSCIKEMDAKQITAIITKHVKEHPEVWNLPLNVEAINALSNACPGGLYLK